MRMLQKDITWISDGLDVLFNGKDRYGFNFIRRKMQAVQHQNKILSPDDSQQAQPGAECIGRSSFPS